MIPAGLVSEALKTRANVGRAYDSTGAHVAYYYIPDPINHPEWRVYRHSAKAMISMLRRVRRGRTEY